MSHKMNYDTLAIELGQVSLQRDTYRELCGELVSELKRILDIAAKGNATGSNRALAAKIAGEAITKAEAILGEKNGTSN